MKVHPEADHWRDFTPGEYASLKASIQAHGVKNAVWTWRGWLIDGKHRWKVCEELGVSCPTQEFTGEEEDIRAFAESMNDPRRHLSDPDRAFAAASMANMERGRPEENASRDAFISQIEAAERFNVGRASVQRAAKVMTDGVSGLAEAVRTNRIPLRLASEVAALPPVEQEAILAAENPKKAAREAVAAKVEAAEEPAVPEPPQAGADQLTDDPTVGPKIRKVQERLSDLFTEYHAVVRTKAESEFMRQYLTMLLKQI